MKHPLPYVIIFIVGISILIDLSDYRTSTFTIQTETIKIQSLNQIVPVSDALVRPLLYTNVSGLEQLPVSEAKTKFISVILPAILVAKHQIETVRIKIDVLREKKQWDEMDSSFYLETKNQYKAKDIDDLLSRIGTLPTSIVLAQAAVESGWGQSRFFLQGNNVFGVWSFNPNEPRIAAGKPRGSKTIYLKAYQNMSHSIIHYFEMLSAATPYRGLRKARLQEADPFALLPYLKNFSERRTRYINQLKAVILQNELTQYDHYRIDPKYLMVD
jgi:Bax protein